MDTVRAVVLAVAGTIVLVTVLTGPFGFVTVPDERSGGGSPGTGNATIAVVSTPGEPTLEPGRQGGDVYYLRVPDTDVEITRLRGNPILSYSLAIDDLGYTHSSVHFLGESGIGRHAVSLSRGTLEADRLDRESYRAEIELTLRVNGTERTVYNDTTTVEVQE